MVVGDGPVRGRLCAVVWRFARVGHALSQTVVPSLQACPETKNHLQISSAVLCTFHDITAGQAVLALRTSTHHLDLEAGTTPQPSNREPHRNPRTGNHTATLEPGTTPQPSNRPTHNPQANTPKPAGLGANKVAPNPAGWYSVIFPPRRTQHPAGAESQRSIR